MRAVKGMIATPIAMFSWLPGSSTQLRARIPDNPCMTHADLAPILWMLSLSSAAGFDRARAGWLRDLVAGGWTAGQA